MLALGLPGFCVFLYTVRVLQSVQDLRSAFWLYVLENGVNIVLAAVALVGPLGGARHRPVHQHRVHARRGGRPASTCDTGAKASAASSSRRPLAARRRGHGRPGGGGRPGEQRHGVAERTRALLARLVARNGGGRRCLRAGGGSARRAHRPAGARAGAPDPVAPRPGRPRAHDPPRPGAGDAGPVAAPPRPGHCRPPAGSRHVGPRTWAPRDAPGSQDSPAVADSTPGHGVGARRARSTGTGPRSRGETDGRASRSSPTVPVI